MTKDIIKCEANDQCKIKDGQPIHLHVPGDMPIYLHITGDERNPGSLISASKSKTVLTTHHQAPWIPPPAKTSLAHIGKEGRKPRKRTVSKPLDEPTHDKQEIPINVNSSFDKSQVNNLENTKHHVCDGDGDDGDDLFGKARPPPPSSTYIPTAVLPDIKECDTYWAKNVLDKWITDLDNSLAHITKSVRNISDCLEEMTFEGRMNYHDVQQLTRPRDELILHSEVAGRVGRELCRWATSIRQQDDRMFTRRLNQSSEREVILNSEIQQLTEKLNRLTVDLQVAKRQLSEQQNESQKFSTVQESLESVRGHLQRQLRQRDSECSRLNTQLHNLESRLLEQKSSNSAQLDMANSKLEKMCDVKDALKRAARSQKRRADEFERELDELMRRLREKDDVILHLQNEVKKYSKNRDLDYLLNEEDDGKGRCCLTELQLKEENTRLNAISRKYEHRLKLAERDLDNLRTNLSNCEALLDNYQGDAATQANRFHVINDRLRKAEEDREHDQVHLNDLERRLQESETRNNILESALQTSKQSDLEKQTKDAEAITELQRQLAQANSEREQIERSAEIRLTDLRAQLNQADGTNRSLQAYLTFLKRSYTSVFQPDILSLIEPNQTGMKPGKRTNQTVVTGCSS